MDYNELLIKLETHLSAEPLLVYVEMAQIMNEPEGLPQMDKYAIKIAPSEMQLDVFAKGHQDNIFETDIICVVRNYHKRLSLIGTQVPDIGILKMIKDTMKSLYLFGQTWQNELEILNDELTKPVRINSHPFPERKGLFHEVVIKYKTRIVSTIGGN